MDSLRLAQMREEPSVTLSPADTVRDALNLMWERRADVLVVVEAAGRPVGLFTERDAVGFACGHEDPDRVLVGDLVGGPPVTAPLDLGCRQGCGLLLEHGIRHLVLVDPSGRFAGTVSAGDFLALGTEPPAYPPGAVPWRLRDQLSKIAATVPGVIHAFRQRPDGSFCFPYASPAIEGLYGLRALELAEDAAPLFAMIHPDDRGHVNRTVSESARTLMPWGDEFRILHPIKGERWIEGRSVPQAEPDGGILWHGFIMDVTDRKRAEEVRHQYRGELERRVEERTAALAAANARLQELDRLKSLFIASMSHELRTPLNSIIGFTGLTLQGQAGSLNAKQSDFLGRVYDSARHLLDVISDIIDVSRVEAGRLSAAVDTFGLRDLVDEAVATVQTEAQERGLAIALDVADVALTTDRKRLLQCLLNLLSNAVKYSTRGEVRIQATEDDGLVCIRVRDQGIGIAAEDVPRLFQQFSRIDSPFTRRTLGTGLGLYLTRKLVTEILGGGVGAESEPGLGSTFWLRIPVRIKGRKHG